MLEEPTINPTRRLTPHCRVQAHTHRVHQQLHRHPVLQRLFSKQLSRAQYGQILLRYYGFYQAFEQRRRELNCWRELSLRSGNRLLQQDILGLLQLGAPPPQADTSFIAHPNGCLASLYVLHGAQAGASLIAKQLKNRLPDLPHYFFATPANREQWQRLVVALNQEGASNDALQHLCDSAEAVFVAFGEWMHGVEV